MGQSQKIMISILRISLGWILLYAGGTKVLNPDWSAVGFLTHANTWPSFWASLAEPGILPIVNMLNQWGQVFLGISLIVGALVPLSSVLAAVMMILYYIPPLKFPYPDEHSFIMDDHIIYALVFILLAVVKAGNYWGLDAWYAKRKNKRGK